MSEEFKVKIRVISFAEEFADALLARDFKGKKEVKRRFEVIRIFVDQPDPEYNVIVRFSKYIKLPHNITEWNHLNEGNDRLNITYITCEETQTVLYDQDLSIDLAWKVVDIGLEELQGDEDLPENSSNNVPIPQNAESTESTNSTQMLSVNWIKLKLDFTRPKIVSRTARDTIKIECQ